MSDELQGSPEAEVVPDAEPSPELAPAVDPVLATAEVGTDIAVLDPNDQHEVMLAMDEHDVSMLLDYVQTKALRKWVYSIDGGKLGLTVHAVQDIAQRMNWTGKARIGVLPETLTTERIVENRGFGDEPFWVATIFARDEQTGSMLPGSAMEPVRMKLKDSTAAAKRKAGINIPSDNTVFDPFSRTKAIQKATRNALKAFIPQEVEQTVLAMFSGQHDRVQRIQTVAEKKAADMPPPVTGPEADAKQKRIHELYEALKELGGGRGRHAFTPAQFHSFLTQSQGSLQRLDDMIGFLESEHERLSAVYAAEEGAS